MNINRSTHTHTATPSVEQNKFVLNDETRRVAYAFLKDYPAFNIEDRGTDLHLTVAQMLGNCATDKDPVTEIVLSSHMYNSFLACKKLIECLEPVNTIREMTEGRVGQLLGSTVYTEAYSHPMEQTMGPKEILFHTRNDKWFRVYTKETSSANV